MVGQHPNRALPDHRNPATNNPDYRYQQAPSANPRQVNEAWAFLSSLLATPNCAVLIATPRHAEIAERVIDDHAAVLRGSILHDAHTVVLMREHGVRRIATRDAAFHRFSSIEVIDPLTAR